MPTYDYECEACGHCFDILQSMQAPKLTQCPACKEEKLNRLIGTGSGVIFKGTGFYATDYKKKSEPSSEAKPSCGNSCPHAGKCGA